MPYEPLPDDKAWELAKIVHERYLADLGDDRDPDRASHQDWDDLTEEIQRLNKTQVDYWHELLEIVQCEMVPAAEIDGRQPVDGNFLEDHIEELGEAEHERWMELQAKRDTNHPDYVTWCELSEKARQKDFNAVRRIPDLLDHIGYHICVVDD